MPRMQEWQKELIGLGIGTSVVHVLIVAALVATIVFVFGGYAQ